MAITVAFEDKLASLTRKPDADTNSPLELWDNTIRSQVAYQGATCTTLLPHGRETLTLGTRDEQLDALNDFGVRLAAQTTKPVLGTTVITFSNAARALRISQTSAKSALEVARANQEALRVSAANALYALIGQGIVTWNATPALVDTLWDVNIFPNAPQQTPEAPADTTWDPATRTLSTTALPARCHPAGSVARRPSIRFLSISSRFFPSLPSPGWSPFPSWLQMVVCSFSCSGISTGDLNPILQRAHAGHTQAVGGNLP